MPSAALSARASPRFCSGDTSARTRHPPAPLPHADQQRRGRRPEPRQRAADLAPAAAVERVDLAHPGDGRERSPTARLGRRPRGRVGQHGAQPLTQPAGHEVPAGAHPRPRSRAPPRARPRPVRARTASRPRAARGRRSASAAAAQGAPTRRSTAAYAATPPGDVAYDDDRGPAGDGARAFSKLNSTASSTKAPPKAKPARTLGSRGSLKNT